LFRMHGAETQREGAALTDAEQVDLRHTGVFRHRIDAAPYVPVDVVVKGQPAVGAVRIPPIDQVDILALRKQVADQRLVFLKVDHVRPIDEGVDDKDRRLRSRLALAAKAVDDHLVLAVDLVLGRDAEIHVVEIAQHRAAGGHLLLEAHRFLVEPRWLELERTHQRLPPLRPDAAFFVPGPTRLAADVFDLRAKRAMLAAKLFPPPRFAGALAATFAAAARAGTTAAGRARLTRRCALA